MNSIKKINNLDSLLISESVIVYVCLIVISIAPLIAPNVTVMNVIRVFCGAACLLLLFRYKTSEVTVIVFFLSCILSVLSIISSLYTGNEVAYSFIWIWVYMGVGCLIAFSNISTVGMAMTSVFISAVYLLGMLFGADPNTMMIAGSRNNISVVLLLNACLYYLIAVSNNEDRISILPALFCFVACVMAEGRSGIIVSATILLIVVVRALWQSKKNVIRFVVCIVAISVFALAVIYIFWDSFQLAVSRFQTDGITDDGREELLFEYFTGLRTSFVNVLLGVPFSDYFWLAHFENPHNSFLFLHSKFGIIGFVIVVSFIIKSIILGKQRLRFFFILIVVALCIRAATDSICFTGIVDIFWWAFIIKSLIKRENYAR